MSESIFTSQTPALITTDALQYEMGVKFQSTVAGTVSGLRYWSVAGEAGTITGHLWTEGGAELGSVGFTSGAPTGWKQALFSSPLAILANTTYVASVRLGTDQGYPVTSGGLTSSISNGHLSTVVGTNGVYNDVAGIFPGTSFGSSNYFRDILFDATSGWPVSTGGMTFSTDGRLLVTSNETPAASSPFTGGQAFRASDGALYIFDLVLTPVPATAKFQRGLAFSPQGALYCTTDTTGPFIAACGRIARADGALLIAAASPVIGTDWANNGIYRKAANGATLVQVL